MDRVKWWSEVFSIVSNMPQTELRDHLFRVLIALCQDEIASK